MSKIELSEKEIEVIKAQLNGEIDGWTATDEQQKLLTGVILWSLYLEEVIFI